MNIYVPDASVVLKWVMPEEREAHLPQALAIAEAALGGRILLRLPSLWYYEIGNIVSRHLPTQADELLQKLHIMLLPWTQGPTSEWQALALELVRRYGVTFYDASYHALAISLSGVMVTADGRYLERASAAGHILALADWRAS